MAVQFKFFHIPITQFEESEGELNGFLRSVRALTIHKEFLSQGTSSMWCLAMEYLPYSGDKEYKKGENRSKVDYREILSPEDFALFVRLREWRKQAASYGFSSSMSANTSIPSITTFYLPPWRGVSGSMMC